MNAALKGKVKLGSVHPDSFSVKTRLTGRAPAEMPRSSSVLRTLSAGVHIGFPCQVTYRSRRL
jgi:hypothetical protein